MTKYDTISQALKQQILDGVYTETLPSELRLAKEYKVSPLTARKALNVLAEEGIINREPGRVAHINQAMIQPVRICLAGDRQMLDEIQLILKEKFTGIDFEVRDDSAHRLSGTYDITHSPTTFLDSYERHFSPFPETLVDEIKSSDLFRGDVLGLHGSHGQYFGLPIVYSPPVIEVNCDLLQRIGMTLPERLDLEVLQECRQALKSLPEQPSLFDHSCFAELLSFQLFYYHLPQDWEKMNQDDWRKLCNDALTDYISLTTEDVERLCDFDAGQALFRIVGKGFFKDNKNITTEYRPIFGSPESPIHAFSESLMFSRTAADPKRLAAVCRAFLEPDIQQVFMRRGRSIPVRRSTAYETFCQSPEKDKIFMNEDYRCIFSRPEPMRGLLGTMWDNVPRYIRGELTAEELRGEIFNHLQVILKQREISNRFLDERVQSDPLVSSPDFSNNYSRLINLGERR